MQPKLQPSISRKSTSFAERKRTRRQWVSSMSGENNSKVAVSNFIDRPVGSQRALAALACCSTESVARAELRCVVNKAERSTSTPSASSRLLANPVTYPLPCVFRES
ncbi:hypothetical protein VTN96DRAFT_9157 [Rasamsonia emersonii]